MTLADRNHTSWSDPGPHFRALDVLGEQPRGIADGLEEFVIHHTIARQLGFGVPPAAEGDRSLRRATALLGTAFARDPRPLGLHRALADYLYVTCRDFALLAMSALRHRGVPARLRVGFAGYFTPGLWMDHWVCEYWLEGHWRLLDAQLGRRAREGMGIGFDIADMPAGQFITGGEAWRAIRSGMLDAETCGLPAADIAGEWWVAASVMRDAAALAGIEALPWDDWGPGRRFRVDRAVDAKDAARIDELAAALDPAPLDRTVAIALLARFSWAAPDDETLANF